MLHEYLEYLQAIFYDSMYTTKNKNLDKKEDKWVWYEQKVVFL
jgi:hypothetical protein